MNEIGLLIKRNRLASGLTQSEMAKLANISRATLISLEKGQLKELGATKLFNMTHLLGIELSLQTKTEKLSNMRYIKNATNSANVSYKNSISNKLLKEALVKAEIPKGFEGNLLYIIDELPPKIMLGVIRAVASQSHKKPREIWLNTLQLAHQMQSPASLWHVAR